VPARTRSGNSLARIDNAGTRPCLSRSPDIEPGLPHNSLGASLNLMAGKPLGIHLEQAYTYFIARVKRLTENGETARDDGFSDSRLAV
jgi:hypothetical protein